MRRALIGSCVGGLTVCLAIYGTAVSSHAQVSGTDNWWPYSWLSVFAAVGVMCCVTWIYLTASSPNVRRSRKPDFLLTRRGGQLWELKRTQRTTALAIRQNDGIHSAPAITAGNWFADLAHGETFLIGMPNEVDCHVWFDWIEGGSRYYCKSEHLTLGVNEAQLKGIEVQAGQPIKT